MAGKICQAIGVSLPSPVRPGPPGKCGAKKHYLPHNAKFVGYDKEWLKQHGGYIGGHEVKVPAGRL
jgi:hypothetical protein